jgi:hypothetical protein
MARPTTTPNGQSLLGPQGRPMPAACAAHAESMLTAPGAQVRPLGGASGGGSPVDGRS